MKQGNSPIEIISFCRTHGNFSDDLSNVRNILHTNMFLCLICVQIFFLFGIDQVKTQVIFICHLMKKKKS